MSSPSNPDADLKGNTLRVYMYLFKVQHSGIREAQRTLGFKSPSLAQYHLDKLVSLGLASRDNEGNYVLLREVKIEALERFLRIGSYLIPRFVFYSVLLSILFGYFIAISGFQISTNDIWTFVFGIIGLSITWYETIRAWRRVP